MTPPVKIRGLECRTWRIHCSTHSVTTFNICITISKGSSRHVPLLPLPPPPLPPKASIHASCMPNSAWIIWPECRASSPVFKSITRSWQLAASDSRFRSRCGACFTCTDAHWESCRKRRVGWRWFNPMSNNLFKWNCGKSWDSKETPSRKYNWETTPKDNCFSVC